MLCIVIYPVISTDHMSVLYPVRQPLCQQKVPLEASHLENQKYMIGSLLDLLLVVDMLDFFN